MEITVSWRDTDSYEYTYVGVRRLFDARARAPRRRTLCKGNVRAPPPTCAKRPLRRNRERERLRGFADEKRTCRCLHKAPFSRLSHKLISGCPLRPNVRQYVCIILNCPHIIASACVFAYAYYYNNNLIGGVRWRGRRRNFSGVYRAHV